MMSEPSISEKPVLFLIPGAWHGGWVFSSIVQPLIAAGHPTRILHLPSTGLRSGAANEKRHDVEHIRSEILKEIERGRQVVPICHSYSAVPTCDAVQGLAKQDRINNHQSGGVIGLIFIAAFVLGRGGTIAEINAKYQRGRFSHHDGMLWPIEPETMFYNDLQHDLASRLSQLLEPHSASTFDSPLEYEAYRSIPSAYLLCTNDQAIAIEAQEEMLSGKIQYFELVERLDSGHTPFISRPTDTINFIHKTLALLVSKEKHHCPPSSATTNTVI